MAEEQKKEKDNTSKISRREFLKDAGLVVGGAAIGSTALFNACKGGATTETVTNIITKTPTVTATGTPGATITVTFPPVTQTGEVSAAPIIKLTVNGNKYELPVDTNWTLQDVLRQKLGITSPKDMCNGYGACASCSVILDGKPILSCMKLAVHCDGAVIETAEGIAAAKHPLIDAYIYNHCMQCGYCTPGFVVTAKALLDRIPKPTEVDIREALTGNICRCGTYPAHIRAVLEASGQLKI